MTAIRPATPDDYQAFAHLFPELKTPDPTPARRLWEADYLPTTSVLEVDGAVRGYCYVQVLSGAGYVRHLVVAEEARGKSFGRRLMEAAQETFRRAGATEMHLNVDPTNVPAVRLYESLGLRRAYGTEVVRFEWSLVDRLPERRGGHVRQLREEEHEAFEARFGLPKGVLRAQLGRSGMRILGLWAETGDRSDGEACGVAAFNPTFPGAFPFKVSHEDWARPLLTGIYALREPSLPEVQVVVEDQAVLAARLVSHGARVLMSIVHMQGPLSA